MCFSSDRQPSFLFHVGAIWYVPLSLLLLFLLFHSILAHFGSVPFSGISRLGVKDTQEKEEGEVR